jgi:hypothetical protein
MPLRRHQPLARSRRVGLVRVCLDDVQAIVNVLAAVRPKVYIDADGYVADSVEDLERIRTRFINNLVLSTQPLEARNGGLVWEHDHEPGDPDYDHAFLGLALRKRDSVLITIDPDIKLDGATARILTLLRERRRATGRILRTSSRRAAMLILALFGVSLASAASFAGAANNLWLTYSLLAIVYCVVIWMALVGNRDTIIIPRWERDAPTFWTRNRDQIIIGLLFTLLGAIIGIFATSILGKR